MNRKFFIIVGVLLVHGYAASLIMLFRHLMTPVFVPTETRGCESRVLVISTSEVRPEIVYNQQYPVQVERFDDNHVRFLASEYIDVTRYPNDVTQEWCASEAANMSRNPHYLDPHRVEGHRGLVNWKTCEFTTTIFMTRIQ